MKFYIFFLLSLYITKSSGQELKSPCPENGICPFYMILLKNNFQLNIGDTINNRRTIRLTGNEIDTIIRSVKLKTPNSDLGWLAIDEDDFFVLYSTYSGNYVSRQPISIYVFQKETGKLLLTGPLIEYDSLSKTILFIEFNQQERLGLFDMKTMKTKFFNPIYTPCESWWWCIKYSEVTAREVIIDYSDWKDYTKRAVYYR